MRIGHFLKSRPVAFAAFIGLFAIGSTAIIVPAVHLFHDQNERIGAALKRLAVYRAQTATRPQLEKRLKAMESTAASLPGLMKTENASIAAAQLQGDIKAFVERNRGEVRTAQILPVTSVNGFEKIAVRNELTIPITSLRDVVYAIETHLPYYFIETMVINGPRDWPQDIDKAPEPRLNINWTVQAFRRSTLK